MLLAMAMLSLQPEGVKPDCGGNTLEMNACFANKLTASEQRLAKYKAAALARFSDDGESAVRLGIEASSSAFESYRKIECDTVLENWKDGTIRGLMTLSCQITLTDERTHTIWANWLQYMDSTPPILPDPKPTL